MFVCSMRASTLKFFAIIGVTLAILLVLVGIDNQSTVYASADGVSINYGGMKTNEDRVKFIESFGIKVKDEPVTEELFSAPNSFDRVIAGYNEIQKSQGLDLAKYTGKRITHYAYEVENYDSEGKVYVNLLVYKNRIVACDISSTHEGGFVLPLVGLDVSKLK